MRMARFSNVHHGTVYLHPHHVVRIVENKNKGGVNVTLSTSSDNKPETMHFNETLDQAIRTVNAALRPAARVKTKTPTVQAES